MNVARISWVFVIVILSGLTVGCGLRVPEISEVWDGPNATKQIEFEIRRRIYCDLKDVAIDTNDWQVKEKDEETGKVTSHPLLPDDWGAEITVSLQVDEASTFNPGVTLNTPIHNGIVNFAGEYLGPSSITVPKAGGALLSATPSTFAFGPLAVAQNYSFGLGGTVSSTATRIDKFNAYWTVMYLRKKPSEGSLCRGAKNPFLENESDTPSSSSPFILEGDLGIKDWLENAISSQAYIPSNQTSPKSSSATNSSKNSGKKDSKSASTFAPEQLQYEVKFIIVTSGNVTPTWKLVRVSANTSNAPLFGTGRTRTHDLLITIGPNKDTDLHVSAQNAQAIAAQLQSLSFP